MHLYSIRVSPRSNQLDIVVLESIDQQGGVSGQRACKVQGFHFLMLQLLLVLNILLLTNHRGLALEKSRKTNRDLEEEYV